MAENFKVSGKRVLLAKGNGASEWRLNPRAGGWILAERTASDGSIERHRFAFYEGKGRMAVQIGGFAFAGEVQAERSGRALAGGSDADLVAQFPGKVRKVLVKAGDQVEEGQALLMVEAMKMEFPVKAPYAGRVSKVHVTDGQQLSPGDRFLDLEVKKNG